MIAFACSVTDAAVYGRCAEPGMRRVGGPDTTVMALQPTASVARTYNAALDRLAGRDDLEAVVFVHQDAEIDDPRFSSTLRAALAMPDAAIAGCLGARGGGPGAWWDGAVAAGSTGWRYTEEGGGDRRAAELGDTGAAGPLPAVVDELHGMLLALGPWAARTLRFDESIGAAHGYAADICNQVAAAGRRAVVADLRVIHHHSLELVEHRQAWALAHARLAAAHGATQAPEGDRWRERARRSEAEAAAARLLLASRQLQQDATTLAEARHLAGVTNTSSWRLTGPLRRLAAQRRAARRQWRITGPSGRPD